MARLLTVPYEPEHLAFVDLQELQLEWSPILQDRSYARLLDIPGMSWTGLIDGRVIGCAGVAPAGATRAIGWGLFSPRIGEHLFDITRLVRFHLDSWHRRGFIRIEAYVRTDFDQGHRWANLLGFTRECDMECFMHDITYTMYARIKRRTDRLDDWY